jgi:YTH domain-containing family protein
MSPPPVPVSPPTGVRRHHTISASSRRSGTRPAISEEEHDQEHWNDDEVVDEDWVGGVGVVGEKSSLHRQSSLPTRYHRGEFLRLLCRLLLTKSYHLNRSFIPLFLP